MADLEKFVIFGVLACQISNKQNSFKKYICNSPIGLLGWLLFTCYLRDCINKYREFIPRNNFMFISFEAYTYNEI